jgi:DNA invertase Pin-like site-specific DNA recombinase
MTKRSAKPVHCAIYTRVSTDQGLEQDFNSLDAQYDASQAYIRSQAHAGWSLLRATYEDGGFSGGNTDRPALQRLLDDVRAGKVDVIVVYKVDRLTRSLADFAKLVELFDKHDVSFVSVTQQFNTTTSMGRLTLNVLLSFAQLEREVTSERIRDKIAASKRKGLWVGGMAPLGYDTKDRKISVNEAEAAAICGSAAGQAVQGDPTSSLDRKIRARPMKAERRAALIKSIARGRAWLDEIVSGTASIEAIAARQKCSVRQVNMTISMAFIAPALVKAAVEGRLPRGIGIATLRDAPAEWSLQFERLGLAHP